MSVDGVARRPQSQSTQSSAPVQEKPEAAKPEAAKPAAAAKPAVATADRFEAQAKTAPAPAAKPAVPTALKDRASFAADVKTSPAAAPATAPAAAPTAAEQKTAKSALDKIGVDGKKAADMLKDPKLVKNLSTAFDEKKPAADRVTAGLAIASSLSKVVDKNKLPEALQKALPGLPAAKEFSNMVAKLTDDKASAIDKAKAIVGFGVAAKDSIGQILPKLKDGLGKLNGPLGLAQNALTIIDPNASIKDKAIAGAKIFGSAKDTLDTLKSLGHPQAGSIGDAASKLKAEELIPKNLPADLQKAMPADVASKLSTEQADQLAKLAKEPKAAEELGKVLKNVTDPKQVESLLKGLEGADGATQKALTGMLSGMDAGKLQKTLSETAANGKPLFSEMGSLVGKLPDGAKDAAAKLFQKFDAGDAKSFMKFAGEMDPKVLGPAVEGMSKLGDNIGVLGKAFGAVDGLLGKFGVKAGKEAAEKVFGAMGKMFPALGAAVAAKDAFDLGKIALDGKQPGEVRFLAGLGAQLNGVDAALGVAEAFGVGNIGLPVNIGLGVAELGIGLAVDHFKQQAAEGNFHPSKELRAGIGVAALATAPIGFANLVNSFGVGGSVGVMKDTIETGGKYAGQAAGKLAELAKEGVKEAFDALKGLGDKGVELLKGLGKEGEKLIKDVAGKAKDLWDSGWDAAGSVLGSIGSALNPFD